MRRLAALSLLAVVALTGCASTDAEPEASSTVEPSATVTPKPTEEPGADPRGATYASIEEMRVDLVAAGVDCPTLVNRDQNPNASETGTCEDFMWLLSTFDDIDARNVVLQLNVDSLEPGTFLAGPNWLLAAGDGVTVDGRALLDSVQPALGGVVWDHTLPFPT
jgi:hypothetical protein